jgi:hypothetical protein
MRRVCGAQQRGCLDVQFRIGVLVKCGGPQPSQGSFQQAVVVYCAIGAEDALGDVQEFGRRQVGHWPSRSSASA